MTARQLVPWTRARMWRELAHVSMDWILGTVTMIVLAVVLSVRAKVAAPAERSSGS